MSKKKKISFQGDKDSNGRKGTQSLDFLVQAFYDVTEISVTWTLGGSAYSDHLTVALRSHPTTSTKTKLKSNLVKVHIVSMLTPRGMSRIIRRTLSVEMLPATRFELRILTVMPQIKVVTLQCKVI